MSVISKLATSLGRRDEKPNVELAGVIARNNDKKAVRELVENLQNSDKAIQADCLKTLYETGYLNPGLVAPYAEQFISLLGHKNNRMVWGAMIAISTITAETPKTVFASLPVILEAAVKGSVISKDNAVNILIKLYSAKTYAKSVYPLLSDMVSQSAINQLPMYAERAMPVLHGNDAKRFSVLLASRIPELKKASALKRIEKVIGKLNMQLN